MRPSRKFLRALCVLTFGGGVALVALGLKVSLAAHLGASAAALAALGGAVVLLSVLGFVGAGRDKSALLLLYFFLHFLLLACLLVACYAAFVFQDALASWLKHHWGASVLNYLRSKSCCETYEGAEAYLKHRVTVLGIVGVVCMVVELIALYCVVRIVTVPIVMKSMLTVINTLFFVLGVGIFAYGLSVKVHDEMTSGQQWIGA